MDFLDSEWMSSMQIPSSRQQISHLPPPFSNSPSEMKVFPASCNSKQISAFLISWATVLFVLNLTQLVWIEEECLNNRLILFLWIANCFWFRGLFIVSLKNINAGTGYYLSVGRFPVGGKAKKGPNEWRLIGFKWDLISRQWSSDNSMKILFLHVRKKSADGFPIVSRILYIEHEPREYFFRKNVD